MHDSVRCADDFWDRKYGLEIDKGIAVTGDDGKKGK